MVHLVRDVPFAEEPLAKVVTFGEIRVQDLDRDPVPVAMARFVNRGHAAAADEAVERVLLVEDGSDALMREFVDRHVAQAESAP